MKIQDLLDLTDKYAERIKNLNPKRFVDTDEIADNLDSFLYWAYEELNPHEVLKRKSKDK